MSLWSYCVPPDIRVSVQTPHRSSFLSRCLGEEIPGPGEPALLLDLVSRRKEQPRGLLSADPVDGALTVRGVHKAIPWSSRISRRSGEGWTLAFSSPILREYLALNIALIPSLRRLLLERGVAFLSCAAFEMDGTATLLAGLTGRGKTTLLLGALERGARLIADQGLGLGENAEVTPVVRALALRQETLALAPQMLRRLKPGRRSALRAGQVTAHLTRRRLQPLLFLSPSELGVSPVDGGWPRVRRLFWLESEPGTESGVRCERMDVRDAVTQLSIIQAVHNLLYGDLGDFLDAAGGKLTGMDYGSRWRGTLERGLEGASCYRLSFRTGEGVLSEVLERVLQPGERAGPLQGRES